MDSYYGRQIVKPHVWKWYIPAYFWFGGMAGASALQTVAARANGNDRLAAVSRTAALAGIVISPALLIADLGRPERFVNMLRVFKPTSPMSVGTYILSAFGGAIVSATAADVLGARRLAIAGEIAAALLGGPLVVYTAVLVSDTATPIWYASYKTLPFVFAASGAGAAGAVAGAFVPEDERALPRRLMIGGSLALLAAGAVMEARLGPLLAEPYRKGPAARLRLVSGALSLAAAGIGAFAGSGTATTRIAGACAIGAGILERFAILAAGTASAKDPRYTVIPQRERLAAGEAARATEPICR